MEINQLPQDKKIILFDGVCNYCNDKVTFIIKNDSKDVFRFVALQSETGQKIITYLGIDKTIDSLERNASDVVDNDNCEFEITYNNQLRVSEVPIDFDFIRESLENNFCDFGEAVEVEIVELERGE